MCTPVMPEEFYPSVPSPLFCWVCGCALGYTQRIRGHPAPFVFEMKKWQLAWERHRCNRKYYRDIFGIHLAVSELDKAFRSGDLYGDLFRLILVDKNGQDCSGEYHISGIAELPGARRGEKYLLVPRNKDRACLGAPESPPGDGTTEEGQVSDKKAVVAAIPVPHPFSSLRHEEGRLDGYVIHSRCWTLMEKHFGIQAMASLGLVVSALHEQWDRIFNCLQRQPGDFPWAYRDFVNYQDWQHRVYCACDPLHIPTINKIFQTSVSSRTRQKKKDVAKVPARRLRGVPTELIYHIAEYLEVTDARNMSIAIGEPLPISYWRKRISDIFVEVEDVDPVRIDWSYLAVMLNTMKEGIFEPKAINDPQGDLSVRLWNRRRIINMLRPVKQRVLQEMRSQVEVPWHGSDGNIG